MDNKKNNPKNNNQTVKKVVTDNGNEFSEDLVNRVGLNPVVGGLVTRNLIKEAEEILMTNENINSPKK
jgi:hypothetical protein